MRSNNPPPPQNKTKINFVIKTFFSSIKLAIQNIILFSKDNCGDTMLESQLSSTTS